MDTTSSSEIFSDSVDSFFTLLMESFNDLKFLILTDIQFVQFIHFFKLCFLCPEISLFLPFSFRSAAHQELIVCVHACVCMCVYVHTYDMR